MNYIILTGGWVIYFVLHSALASEGVKDMATRLTGNAFRFYRLFYSILSIVGLAGLLFFDGAIQADNYFENGLVIRFLSLVCTVFGVRIIQLAFRQHKLKSFLGFEKETSELKITGILKIVRHPIYAGLILITAGFFLLIPNTPTLISCLCILIYLPIGIYLEEKKLIAAFGEQYLDYKKRVPAVFPDFR